MFFPVRPSGQGSLCAGTPSGRGGLGEMVGCAPQVSRIEVMVKKAIKPMVFFNNSGATPSETAAGSLFSVLARDL